MDLNKNIEIKSIFDEAEKMIIEINCDEILSAQDIDELILQYKDLFAKSVQDIVILYQGKKYFYSVLEESKSAAIKPQLEEVAPKPVEVSRPVETKQTETDSKKTSAIQRRMELLRKDIKNVKQESKEKTKAKKIEVDERVIYRSFIKNESKEIDPINDENNQVIYEGFVFSINTIVTRTETQIVSFYLTDKKSAIKCKMFVNKKDLAKYKPLKENTYCKLKGTVKYDTYDAENILSVNAACYSEYVETNIDNYPDKRVELHMHTNMTAMSGICNIDKIVDRAKKNGHKAIAITDNSVIQAYPDAMRHQSDDFKVIYGLEANVIDYDKRVANFDEVYDFNATYVVFDLETTGFSPINDRIIEIGAVKISDKKVVETFSSFVNPEMHIPKGSTDVCGITDDMVKDADTVEVVLPKFIDFCGDAILLAHNAEFDMSFVRENVRRLGVIYNPGYMDTLTLSRLILTNIKRHGLKFVCRELGVSLINHHRAYQDAEATANALIKLYEKLEDKGIYDTAQLNEYAVGKVPARDYKSVEMTILVQKQSALRDFYKMISTSNMDTYHNGALLKRSDIVKSRDGLLIGSGGVKGELFKAVMNKSSEDKLIEIAKFYDYLEIQPVDSAQNLFNENMLLHSNEYYSIVRKIVALGEKLNIPVVATANPYFLDEEDEILRDIILNSTVPFIRLKKSEKLYYRTTSDMLREFDYLGKDKSKEVVITNTNAISDMIELVKPIPDETFPPFIEGSDENLKKMCYKKAQDIYGVDLPHQVSDRLDRELTSIISNGYAVMYIIASQLVKKSEEDGYLVGSRGSVGSSFAATMSGITEVNPLEPHYLCQNGDCHFVTFDTPEGVYDGFDLPDMDCPKCSAPLTREGHDIPFETFLGFDGDKEPDIDLNFASIYQANAHEYTKVLFGEGHVFKAGTISTVAGKKAFGYVKKYFERIDKTVSNGYCSYMANNLEGIKATTGQHPGGIMVVPQDKDIHDFTPIQYPANDAGKGVITTHFDYHSISGKILKLDLLGHESPTTLKILEQLTGLDALHVRFDDKKTMEVFRSTKSLGIKEQDYDEESGSLGIPEFGTHFVRQMLKDTMPTTFIELVKIAGLAHGTDVWLNNAQELVRSGTCTLMDAICTRDEIMTYLIRNGLEKKDSFSIMEKVRKGKGLSAEHEQIMRDNNIPNWYIDSCKKIKYMFPAAHSVAYVMMSFRIAYFKVYHPLAFYAAYFSSKISDFDTYIISKGLSYVDMELKKLKEENQQDNKVYVLELAKEMLSRGYEFKNIDLKTSEAHNFTVVEGKLQIPFKALKGFGEKAAENVVASRGKNPLYSVEDLKKIPGVNKSSIEALNELGVLDNMPKTNQFSLDMFL